MIFFTRCPSSQLLTGNHTSLVGSKLFTDGQSEFMGCWLPALSDLDPLGEGSVMLLVGMDLQAGCLGSVSFCRSESALRWTKGTTESKTEM